jgi:hypothetical protein
MPLQIRRCRRARTTCRRGGVAVCEHLRVLVTSGPRRCKRASCTVIQIQYWHCVFFTTICTLQSILGLPARWNSWYFWLDNWKDPDSKPEDWCSEVLHGFPQRFQANAGIVPQIKPRPLPSASFSFPLFGYIAWANERVVKHKNTKKKQGPEWYTVVDSREWPWQWFHSDWVRLATLYRQ